MAFHSLHDFFHMGGFALYVWPAYVICGLCMAVYALRSRVKYSNIINRLKREYESNS